MSLGWPNRLPTVAGSTTVTSPPCCPFAHDAQCASLLSAGLINVQVFDKSMKIVTTCHGIVMALILSQSLLSNNSLQGCACTALV
eukprot:2162988-Prymnesium_polylepis.1